MLKTTLRVFGFIVTMGLFFGVIYPFLFNLFPVFMELFFP